MIFNLDDLMTPPSREEYGRQLRITDVKEVSAFTCRKLIE